MQSRAFPKSLFVTLSEAKGLCAGSGILRFAQNDRWRAQNDRHPAKNLGKALLQTRGWSKKIV